MICVSSSFMLGSVPCPPRINVSSVSVNVVEVRNALRAVLSGGGGGCSPACSIRIRFMLALYVFVLYNVCAGVFSAAEVLLGIWTVVSASYSIAAALASSPPMTSLDT